VSRTCCAGAVPAQARCLHDPCVSAYCSGRDLKRHWQSAPPVKTQSEKVATVPPPEKPTPPEVKRKVEIVLTAAAIAAIIIKASRDQYHATGRPCACPDDSMRNGRACGSRSAYSRPGGAAPLCYTHDITPAMIDAYRKTASAQR
jgi:hypothetical protein